MGLDWIPLVRPRPGFQKEFSRLVQQFRLTTGKKNEAIASKMREISQAHFELLGAPRVGFDRAADKWLEGELAGKPRKLKRARKSMHGYYVLELLPECDGFPLYSNSAAYGDIDRASFRGQFLKDAEAILGPKLMMMAYEMLTAQELKRFGQALLRRGRTFAKSRGVEAVESLRDVEFHEESDASRAHIIFAAAKWCLYWAKRGHGLEPWY